MNMYEYKIKLLCNEEEDRLTKVYAYSTII